MVVSQVVGVGIFLTPATMHRRACFPLHSGRLDATEQAFDQNRALS